MRNLKNLLNEKQYEAVINTNGPLLILAGAGSGKTRVITYKIAYLMNNNVKPNNILALTFTNKAAKEMKERVLKLINQKKTNILISTFHSLGVRILKSNIKHLGYRSKFSIYDDYDCKKLIKDIIKELKLSTEKYEPNQVSYKISDIKMKLNSKIEDKNLETIYNKYQKYLKIYNAVDFNDLIKLPLELFVNYPNILKKYQKKWKYVLVDEYQDTSIMQYNFLKLLAFEHKNLSVVGDDDQSIYSWRGANSENISLFEKDFYPIKEIRLEQNYRSTGNILKAANDVIKNNSVRKSKSLWTTQIKGDLLKIYDAEDEDSEAEFVSVMIRKLKNEGYDFHDFGVLFRMNSQSRPFEEVFRENDMPYRMVGAINFFERPEIRDIISYMKFFANVEDEVSLVRIINNPKRGIGNTTLLSLMNHAKERNSSLYGAIKDFVKIGILGKKTTSYLEDFYKLCEEYREKIFIPKNIAKTVQELIEKIDYRSKLIGELKDMKKITQRLNNINQLIQSISRYENDPDNFDPNLYEYLQRVSLTPKDDENDKNNMNKINLMSIHSAKGLEFKVVFLVGVEEGLLPHFKTIEETGTVEEERRLFYVAITRAQEKLFISYPKSRMKFYEKLSKEKSSFIDELPEELVEVVNLENEIDVKKSLDLVLKKWEKETSNK